MPRKDFSVRQEGIDYFFLIVRHIDRMSDGLTAGLGVGEINTKPLIAYHQMVLHFESLLTPFADEEFKKTREKLEKDMPDFSDTWSGDIKDQINYFKGVSKLFRLLIILAYNKGVLKIKITKEAKTETGLMEWLLQFLKQ